MTTLLRRVIALAASASLAACAGFGQDAGGIDGATSQMQAQIATFGTLAQNAGTAEDRLADSVASVAQLEDMVAGIARVARTVEQNLQQVSGSMAAAEASARSSQSGAQELTGLAGDMKRMSDALSGKLAEFTT